MNGITAASKITKMARHTSSLTKTRAATSVAATTTPTVALLPKLFMMVMRRKLKKLADVTDNKQDMFLMENRIYGVEKKDDTGATITTFKTLADDNPATTDDSHTASIPGHHIVKIPENITKIPIPETSLPISRTPLSLAACVLVLLHYHTQRYEKYERGFFGRRRLPQNVIEKMTDKGDILVYKML